MRHGFGYPFFWRAFGNANLVISNPHLALSIYECEETLAMQRYRAKIFISYTKRCMLGAWITWIWILATHPRVFLFIWTVAWDCFPMREILRDHGMDIVMTCLVCDSDVKTLRHVISVSECKTCVAPYQCSLCDHSIK